MLSRARLGQAGTAEVLRRLANLPRAAWGSALAHFGVGLMVTGIVGTTAWQSEQIVAMKSGEKAEIAGYTLEFRGIEFLGEDPTTARRSVNSWSRVAAIW